jgi:hypothetical protein
VAVAPPPPRSHRCLALGLQQLLGGALLVLGGALRRVALGAEHLALERPG